MAYQTAKKRQESVPPMAGNHNVDAAAAAPKIAGGAYGLDQAGLGSDLEAQMQARIARFQSRQNPVAEQEADTIAEGITGRTPAEVKAELGEKMGADFSEVRFHTGADALGRAESMGARAYATGRDVYFGEGGFDPTVAAHELVHTAQQGAVDSGMSTVSAPMGGVQMMPKLLSKIGSGIKKAGSAIGRAASWVGNKVKGLFSKPPVPYGPPNPTPQQLAQGKQANDKLIQQQALKQSAMPGLDYRLQATLDSAIADDRFTSVPSIPIVKQARILDLAEQRKEEKNERFTAAQEGTKQKYGDVRHFGDYGRRVEALWNTDDDAYNDTMMDAIDKLYGMKQDLVSKGISSGDPLKAAYANQSYSDDFKQKLQQMVAPIIQEVMNEDLSTAQQKGEEDYYGTMNITGKIHALGDLLRPLPEDLLNETFGGADARAAYQDKAKMLVGGVLSNGTTIKQGLYDQGAISGAQKFGYGKGVRMLQVLRDFAR